MPSSTVTLSPAFTLSRAGGGKCSFIDPSGVFTSTHPFFASTLVTLPSMVWVPPRRLGLSSAHDGQRDGSREHRCHH